MKKSNRLTIYILIAMALGIITGYIMHENASAETQAKYATNLKLLTTISGLSMEVVLRQVLGQKQSSQYLRI